MSQQYRRALLLAVPLILVQAVAFAQPETVPPQPDLSRWWTKSSMQIRPMPTRALIHTEASLSYADFSGNAAGSQWNGGLDVVVRKGYWTSRSSAKLARQSMSFLAAGTGTVDLTQYTFRQHFERDLTADTTVLAGAELHSDSSLFIDRCMTYYAAVGRTLVSSKARGLSLSAGVGYSSYHFDAAAIAAVDPGDLARLATTRPVAWGALVQGTGRYTLAPHVELSETVDFLEFFGDELGYRWSSNTTLSMPLSQGISVELAYQVKYQQNEVIDALGLSPRDETFTTGLRASF